MIKYAKGTIWWAKLGTDELTSQIETHIQFGARPVLIVSPNDYNDKRAIVTIVPLTTTKDNMPYHIDISTPQKDSFALVDQIRPIDKCDLDNYMGTIEDEKFDKVELAIQQFLGLGC